MPLRPPPGCGEMVEAAYSMRHGLMFNTETLHPGTVQTAARLAGVGWWVAAPGILTSRHVGIPRLNSRLGSRGKAG